MATAAERVITLIFGPLAWELAPSFFMHCGAQVVTFVPCFVFVRRRWPDHKDPWALADTMVSIVIFPLLTYSAIVACWKNHETVEARWRGKTPEGSFMMMLYMTRQMLHMPVQCMQRMPKIHLVSMSVHHVLSIVCFGGGILTAHMEFWACLDGCCEMSTIFLNNLYMLKEVTIDGKELKEYLPAWVNAVNGFALWLSFLVFRLMLFPFWLYHWYRDTVDFPRTWTESSFLEAYVYPSVTVLLLVLSTIWFVPVTKGFLKALSGVRKSKEARLKKAE